VGLPAARDRNGLPAPISTAGGDVMRDTAGKVHYDSTSVPDRPGEAFRVLQTFVCAGTTRAPHIRHRVLAARFAGLQAGRARRDGEAPLRTIALN
jgi:hypothetical protein